MYIIIPLCYMRSKPCWFNSATNKKKSLLTKDIQNKFHTLKPKRSTAMKMVANSRNVGVKANKISKTLNNL